MARNTATSHLTSLLKFCAVGAVSAVAWHSMVGSMATATPPFLRPWKYLPLKMDLLEQLIQLHDLTRIILPKAQPALCKLAFFCDLLINLECDAETAPQKLPLSCNYTAVFIQHEINKIAIQFQDIQGPLPRLCADLTTAAKLLRTQCSNLVHNISHCVSIHMLSASFLAEKNTTHFSKNGQ